MCGAGRGIEVGVEGVSQRWESGYRWGLGHLHSGKASLPTWKGTSVPSRVGAESK